MLDLQTFIKKEKPYWDELDTLLLKKENGLSDKTDYTQAKRLIYLYERVSSDLSEVRSFSIDDTLIPQLESLVARAYRQIFDQRHSHQRFQPLTWFFKTFPRTVREHKLALSFTIILFCLGACFGAAALTLDIKAKPILMPFPHLQGDPRDRVAMEEQEKSGPNIEDSFRSSFAAQLMTHNTKVSIFSMALGLTWGIGTFILIFYNGIILGAVCIDYILAGQHVFLIAWLLPHGSIEIPSIFLATQSGFIFAAAMIGRKNALTLKQRLLKVLPDVATLISGVALLLIWAGLIESFFSQYHHPVLPYWLKITFGAIQLLGLILFLTYSGKTTPSEKE